MSAILEFQQYVRDVLNEVEDLVQGGCKAFAEDEHDILKPVPKHLSEGGTAIVVTTPEFRRDGCAADGLPLEATLRVVCEENPAILRAKGDASRLTALDAAELVASELDGEKFNCAAIRQSYEPKSGILTATVEFNVHLKLS